jgi:hypothetical protein
MLRGVDDDRRARDFLDCPVQTASQPCVRVQVISEATPGPQSIETIKVPVTVDGPTQPHSLAHVHLFPAAEGPIADLAPELTVTKAISTPASVITPQSALPDEDELAHGEAARSLREHPLE